MVLKNKNGLQKKLFQLFLRLFNMFTYPDEYFWLIFFLFQKFECSICHLIFRQRHQFVSHIKIAHNKNFQCSICNRKFSTHTVLKAHTNSVHFKSKPHKCSICSYSSYFESNLNSHIQKVHEKSSTSAEQVNKWFYQAQCLADF